MPAVMIAPQLLPFQLTTAAYHVPHQRCLVVTSHAYRTCYCCCRNGLQIVCLDALRTTLGSCPHTCHRTFEYSRCRLHLPDRRFRYLDTLQTTCPTYQVA